MDRFAQIAKEGVSVQERGLIIPEPEKKDAIFLQNVVDDRYQFTPLKKMDSEEELSEALLAAREEYRPYMQDLAPAMEELRERMPLQRAGWRIQTEADQQDFQGVLDGKGQWEEVRLPHYGAPVGKATTFYRMRFDLTESMLAKDAIYLCFKGVDYKAAVYVNYRFVGFHEGFFAPFEFQITDYVHEKDNVLLVVVDNDAVHSDGGEKIYAATGLGFDDSKVGWHHCPPGMGIYQDVYVEGRSAVSISDIFVRPMENLEDASCWIEVSAAGPMKKKVRLELSLYGQNFDETVFTALAYAPSTNLEVGLGDSLTEAQTKADDVYHKPMPLFVQQGRNQFKIPFHIPGARRWSNSNPWLYQVQVRLLDEEGTLLDCRKQQFGMRFFSMDTEGERKGRFVFNGETIRLRGANTMGHEQQCIYKGDMDQLMDDILLAKLCNMNFLRITQRPVQPEFYEYCDRMCLMLQTDFPLFGMLSREKFCECIREAEEMERLIRSHACCILVTYINEPFPNASNQPHRCLERRELEEFFAAANIAVRLQNPDRVIKPIDGDYNPPEETSLPDNHCYPCWYNGHGIDIGRLYKGYWMYVKPGWYYGCGEFGTEGLDPVSVMRKYYPSEWLPQTEEEEAGWSPEKIVGAQTGRFHYFFYKTPETLAQWVEKSQEHQRFATQIMTEAFRRDSRMNTFAIHLFIDAFPSGWMKTIMDVERRPKPAYFAYRNALEPILVSLRTDRFTYFAQETAHVECYICNDTNQYLPQSWLQYYAVCDGKVLISGRHPAKVSACTSQFQGYISIPMPSVSKNGRKTVTVVAGLFDGAGRLLQDASQEITVFGAARESLLGIQLDWHKPQLFILGNGGKASALLQDMELEAQPFPSSSPQEAGVTVVDDYLAYAARKDSIDAWVRGGGRLVFLELPAGRYQIADDTVEVRPCPMLPVHFAAVEDVPFMDGFEEQDFRFWYDEQAEYITPLAENVVIGENFDRLLGGATAGDRDHWTSAHIAAMKECGKGRIILCELKLPGRVNSNPVAKRFAAKLLEN